MRVRALRSFGGPTISMAINEVRDISADEARHLIRAGHVEAEDKEEQEQPQTICEDESCDETEDQEEPKAEKTPEKNKKAVKADDSKPGNKSGR